MEQKPRKEITWLDSARNRKRVRVGFYLSLAVLLAVETLIPKHGHFPWEDVFGFYAAYGFIACVSLIFLAKGLRRLVKRDETYYD